MHIKKLLILSLWIASNIFCNEELLNAVSNGDIDRVQSILKADTPVNINFTNTYGDTALMTACEKNYLDIAQLLIEKGANPNLQDLLGYTALMIACEKHYLDIAQLLITNNANLDLQSLLGTTALMIACKQNHFDIVQLLIENKANLDLREATSDNALMWAYEMNHMDIAALLVLAGADVSKLSRPNQLFFFDHPIFRNPMVNFARNLRAWLQMNSVQKIKVLDKNIEKAFDTVQAVDEEKIIAGLMLNNELNMQLAMELALQFRLADETFAINHFNEIYAEYKKLTGH